MSTLLAACNSLVLGVILLYTCIFTLSIPHSSLLYVRLVIAPLAILCFWDFGLGPYRPSSLMFSGGTTAVGWYMIMRVIEHTVVGLWDPTAPHWVERAGKDSPRLGYPTPQSFRERCFYAFDLLTSQRGSSWSPYLQWDWMPYRFKSWSPAISSRHFLMASLKSMLIQYLLIDLCDTITKSRTWDTSLQYPVSSLPVLEQVIFSVALCAGTFLSIDFGYTVTSATCVLCGSSPNSWPPMFDSPFSSTSLRDFWSHRWHRLFGRVFERLSIPLVYTTTPIIGLLVKDHHKKVYIASTIRPIAIFGLSTLLHLVIMHRVAQQAYRKNYTTNDPTFWDPGTFKFFMSQSLGVAFESTVISRIADWRFPSQEHSKAHHQTVQDMVPSAQSSPQVDVIQNGSANTLRSDARTGVHRWEREALTRVYVWLFLLWTGRWWADKWVRSGFFNENEIVVPFSIWRGLWHGKWRA